MRHLTLLFTFLALAFAPVPKPKTTAEGELRRLKGEWDLVSISHGGKAQRLHKLRWAFSGNNLVATSDGGVDRWTVTLDPKANPNAMDLRMPAGKGEYFLINAAYALDGDKLTVSYDLDDWWARPKDVAGKGAGDYVRVFKRAKR